MLTKRQKKERNLAVGAFFVALIILMTLFLPNATFGQIKFSGMDLVFGERLYHSMEPINISFSWYNMFVFFLPITAGILLIGVDRIVLYESKIKFWMSIVTSIMFAISIFMLYFVPSNTTVRIGDIILKENIELYIGMIVVFIFMLTGLIANLLYLYQEIKIHRIFR